MPSGPMRAHYSHEHPTRELHEHPTREHADADGQVWSDLGRFAGQVRAAVRRGPGLVAGTQRPGTPPLTSMLYGIAAPAP